jgi:hypothetical protein
MTSVIRDRDLITSYAAVVSISFFIALFSCDFAHGQQEDDTTSIPTIGALMRPISTLAPLITPLSPPIPPSTNNIPQQQEQIIGSDSLVPFPSPGSSSILPIEEELADRPLFQPQGEQTSETQLAVEQEQRQQQLTVNEILKDPTGQAAELIEEEKEGTELEIKQRLDEIGGDEDGDNEGSQRGGVREEQNNREEDNANSDTINDGEAPLDLQLPIPFP